MITPDMFYIDEEATQKPLKKIDKLDLAFPKILTKEIYKLQISVVQEIQSQDRTDATNLQIV